MNMKLLTVEEIDAKIFNQGSLLLSGGAHTAFSAFVPAQLNGRFAELAFVYTLAPSRRRSIPRPFAWFAVDSLTGALLFYRHCAYEDFVPTKEFPPESRIDLPPADGQTVADALAKREEWKTLYEKVRDFAFTPVPELSEEQRKTARDYRAVFAEEAVPGLIPYYKALSPSFFRWLDEAA